MMNITFGYFVLLIWKVASFVEHVIRVVIPMITANDVVGTNTYFTVPVSTDVFICHLLLRTRQALNQSFLSISGEYPYYVCGLSYRLNWILRVWLLKRQAYVDRPA